MPIDAAPALRNLVERKPRRHRLARGGAIARADEFGLRAPRGDARGVIGMRGEPCFDGVAPLGRQFAVDIGVEFVFGHNDISIGHRLCSLVISCGAAPGARRRDRL